MDYYYAKKAVTSMRNDSFYSDVAYQTAEQINTYVKNRKLKFLGMNWILVNEKKTQKKHSPYRVKKNKNVNISFMSDVGPMTDDLNRSQLDSLILNGANLEESILQDQYESIDKGDQSRSFARRVDDSSIDNLEKKSDLSSGKRSFMRVGQHNSKRFESGKLRKDLEILDQTPTIGNLRDISNKSGGLPNEIDPDTLFMKDVTWNPARHEYEQYLKAHNKTKYLQSKLANPDFTEHYHAIDDDVLHQSMFNRVGAKETKIPISVLQKDPEDVDARKNSLFHGRTMKIPLTNQMESKIKEIINLKEKRAHDVNENFGRKVIKDVFQDFYEKREKLDTTKNSKKGLGENDSTHMSQRNLSVGSVFSVNSQDETHMSKKLQNYGANITKKILNAKGDRSKLDEIIRGIRSEIPVVMENPLLKRQDINIYSDIKIPAESPFYQRKVYDKWFVPQENRYELIKMHLNKNGLISEKQKHDMTTPKMEKKQSIPHFGAKTPKQAPLEIKNDKESEISKVTPNTTLNPNF